MPGLLSDDGYIYQRKIVIYYLLDALISKKFADCKIELQYNKVLSESDNPSFSIDFEIKLNNGMSRFYEVKNSQLLHRKDKLKNILLNFYEKFSNSSDKNNIEFFILHSCQLKGSYLEKLHSEDISIREDTIKKITGINDTNFSSKVGIRQIIDVIDTNIESGVIDLMSISVIDKILKECGVMVYGAAESVYQAIRTCFENLQNEQSTLLKKKKYQSKLTYPLKEEGVLISFEKIIDHANSFIDKIQLVKINKKREDFINDFYTTFSVPIPINQLRVSIT